jgi:GNAT superfamily N-acetyltransferase
MGAVVEQVAIEATEFLKLRDALDWGRLSSEDAQRSLDRSLFFARAMDGDEVVGFGRVVGDGVMYFYIQDMMVAANRQGEGIGARILESLLQQIRGVAIKGATVGLMAARGKSGFYARYGFIKRPSEIYDAGMTLVLA